MNKEKIQYLIRELLLELGEDISREGLLDTPKRVAEMYSEVFATVKNKDFKDYTTFTTLADNDNNIFITNIPFYTMCEHHLLPFFGTVHIGYIPQNKIIIGLSKVHRIVEHLSKKPNVQENLTIEIANKLNDILLPNGVAVLIKARHMCIEMRGIKMSNSVTKTSHYIGLYKQQEHKTEFLTCIDLNNIT